MCGTKNSEWKIYELSIQYSIDNCIKTTRIKSNSANSNKQKCLANPAFMRVCGITKGLLITN